MTDATARIYRGARERADGMWGGRRCPEPVTSIKREDKKSSVGYAVDGRWKPPAIICGSSYFERGAGDGPAKNRKKWESGGKTSRVLSGRNPAS